MKLGYPEKSCSRLAENRLRLRLCIYASCVIAFALLVPGFSPARSLFKSNISIGTRAAGPGFVARQQDSDSEGS